MQDRDENLVDVVERLERATLRLERILDGDSELASPGMLAQHRKMMVEVETLKDRTADGRTWTMGYGIFFLAMLLTIKEVRDYLEIPPQLAVILMGALAAAALVFFANGLGFVRWLR